ncbi:MAG: hypothetical protein LBO67_07160, partial [Spirochaetaceae bacterium]|nr:hypothetical protein [Spirochaetaceae bacterium]
MKQIHRVWILCVAALLIAEPAPLFANVEAFKNTIAGSETETQKSPQSSGHAGSISTTDSSMLGELIAQLLLLLWLPDNFFFTYGAYPYVEGGFIQRPKSTEAEDFEGFDFNKKNHSFSVGVSAFHLGGIGAGSWVSLSGNIFKFFGPYLDAYVITDTEQVLGGGRAGLHFSFIQSNIYNLAWYAQWQGWGGALSRHAFVTGLDTRIYPVKPLTIRLKAGFQLFSSLSLGELEGEIGVMVK